VQTQNHEIQLNCSQSTFSNFFGLRVLFRFLLAAKVPHFPPDRAKRNTGFKASGASATRTLEAVEGLRQRHRRPRRVAAGPGAAGGQACASADRDRSSERLHGSATPWPQKAQCSPVAAMRRGSRPRRPRRSRIWPVGRGGRQRPRAIRGAANRVGLTSAQPGRRRRSPAAHPSATESPPSTCRMAERGEGGGVIDRSNSRGIDWLQPFPVAGCPRARR
jgi:hypothetical protein